MLNNVVRGAIANYEYMFMVESGSEDKCDGEKKWGRISSPKDKEELWLSVIEENRYHVFDSLAACGGLIS